MSIQELYSLFLLHPIVSTDTRNIQPSSIFFALKGDNFDGNEYAIEAIKKGAAFSIVSDPSLIHEACIYTEDTLACLQELAKHHRLQLKIPIIGITGSNGKTTTKELIKSVLSEKYKVFATHGNLNNHIGVPLSLLSITNEHEIAIIEMGANHQKEIEFLASISSPDCGLITNIGKAHLEGYGGIEGVEKGKAELITNLLTRNKPLFINLDDEKLAKYGIENNRITYGQIHSDFIGKMEASSPFLNILVKYKGKEIRIESQLIGTYNFSNILAAVTIGDYYNVNESQIKKGIEKYIPTNNRSQLIARDSNKIILDAYNANPSSMVGAIANLIKTPANSKLFILGDMLELGDDSNKEHQVVINSLIKNKLKGILVGKIFCSIPQKEFKTFDTNNEAIDYLKEIEIHDTLILIKGSRGIKLETILEVL